VVAAVAVAVAVAVAAAAAAAAVAAVAGEFGLVAVIDTISQGICASDRTCQIWGDMHSVSLVT
jgi:hypothetical protein